MSETRRAASTEGEADGSARAVTGAALLDAAFVVVFAAIGRASHAEDVLGGLAVTAWPFLVALAAGWAVTLAWRAPAARAAGRAGSR